MEAIYRIVERDEFGQWMTCEPQDVAAWCKSCGFKIIGVNTNKHHRSELQGEPVIQGLLGPMYDGEQDGVPVIRYENQAAYTTLSA